MSLEKPSRAIIATLDLSEVLEFQYNPRSFDENIVINYGEISSALLPHPFFQYSGGEAEEIGFTIETNDLGGSSINSSPEDRETEKTILFLYKFAPMYDFDAPQPPPLFFSYGNFRRRCILTKLNITRESFYPDTLIPYAATIDVSLKVLPT